MAWSEWFPISLFRQTVQHVLGVAVLLIGIRLIRLFALYLVPDESVSEALHLIESFVAVIAILLVSIEFIVLLGKAVLASIGEENGQE